MSKRGVVAVKHSGHRVEVDRPNTGRQHARCTACGLTMDWKKGEWTGPLLGAEACAGWKPGDVEKVAEVLAPGGIAIFEEEPTAEEIRETAKKILAVLR
jgi:hypothetical protein